MRQRLWPSDTFVDFEHGLNAAVKRLRDVLGDSADRPRYIETVPRRGYRLIAPLENGQSLAQPLPPALTWSEPRTHARRWWALGLGVLALVAVLAGWRYFKDPRSEPGPVTRPLTRLTFGPGPQTDVTWSQKERFIKRDELEQANADYEHARRTYQRRISESEVE